MLNLEKEFMTSSPASDRIEGDLEFLYTSSSSSSSSVNETSWTGESGSSRRVGDEPLISFLLLSGIGPQAPRLDKSSSSGSIWIGCLTLEVGLSLLDEYTPKEAILA